MSQLANILQTQSGLFSNIANLNQQAYASELDRIFAMLQGGAPNFQEGVLGDVIGAAGTVLGAHLGKPTVSAE